MHFGKYADLKAASIKEIIDRVGMAMRAWPELAEAAGVPDDQVKKIMKGFRWDLSGRIPKLNMNPEALHDHNQL